MPTVSRTGTQAQPASDWLVVVVAQQRSGTTALRYTLARGRRCHDYGEVFHSQRGDDPFNYFNFRQAQTIKQPRLSFPSPRSQRWLWEQFLGHLRAGTSRRFVLVDIKYNSWHHLEPVWHYHGDRPALVDLVNDAGIPVLHIVRQNVFAQACSSKIAQHRGVWHVGGPTDLSTSEPALRIDPRTLHRMIGRSHGQTKRFRRWFEGHPRYAELTYEEMFVGDSLAPAAYAALSELLGEDLDEGQQVPIKKTTTDLRALLANADEVRTYFSGTAFEAIVAESLSPSETSAPRAALS
jgi:LPS sulfotransferase NodH